MNFCIITTLSCLALVSVAVNPALAGQAAQRVDFDHSSVALLRGPQQNGAWSAGLEIKLPGNWKTYWKVPGDAGIPPDFDWSGSENLESVSMSWPAPHRYRDEAGESIGYKHQVVFPLKVTPREAGLPVKLRLKLFYAACDDICVPGQAELAMDLSSGADQASDVALIEMFSAKVPVKNHKQLRLEDAHFTQSNGELALDVELYGVEKAEKVDVFVSGSDIAYFRQPESIGANGDLRTYRLIVDGAKTPDGLKSKSLEIVVVVGQAAIRHEMTIE